MCMVAHTYICMCGDSIFAWHPYPLEGSHNTVENYLSLSLLISCAYFNKLVNSERSSPFGCVEPTHFISNVVTWGTSTSSVRSLVLNGYMSLLSTHVYLFYIWRKPWHCYCKYWDQLFYLIFTLDRQHFCLCSRPGRRRSLSTRWCFDGARGSPDPNANVWELFNRLSHA